MSVFLVPREQIAQRGVGLRPGRFYADSIRPPYATRTLEQVADVVIDSARIGQLASQGLPYADISSIDAETGLLVNLHSLDACNIPVRARRLAQAGDLLLSTVRPERGAVAIVPDSIEQLIVSDALAVARPKKISSATLWVWLRSSPIRQWLEAMAIASVAPRISLKEVGQIPIPQEITSRAESLSHETLRTINELASTDSESHQREDPLVVGLGIQMSTVQPPIYWVKRQRLDAPRLDPKSYSPRHKQLENALTHSPYPVRPLGELGELYVGTPTKRHADADKVRPLLGPSSVTVEGLVVSEVRSLALLRDPVEITTGDVIVALAGAVGRAAVVPAAADGMVINNNLALCRVGSDCLPEYLAAYLNSALGRELVEYLLTGTFFPRLTLRVLTELPVVFPPTQLQAKLVQQLSCNDQAAHAANRLSDLEEALRSALKPHGS